MVESDFTVLILIMIQMLFEQNPKPTLDKNRCHVEI